MSETKQTRLQEAKFAMTFEQIGKELGITKQAADQLCRYGLRKLRRERPQAVALLIALGRETARLREARQSILPEV